MSVRATYWVWRRELHVVLRAPIVYLVGGMFLVVQGVAFAGLVGALSDPRRPAPLGALLEGQLAGTLLTWVLELVVLTLLGMRAIADDKRSGGWELLLTAQCSEAAAVIGKWLAAATVYALLWLPTLGYLGVVAVFRADDGGWDLATIAMGYVGAIGLGAALLAWAVAASAAMSQTLAAGALGFAWLIGMFLIGELPALWPDLAIDHPTSARVLDAVSLRRVAGGFARGELDLGSIVFVIGLAVTGLSLAIALACVGRRRHGELTIRVAATVALGITFVLAGVLVVRHPMRIDVTESRRNSLDPATLAVLGELPGAATLTIVQPTLGGLEPIYDEVARVALRMAEATPGMVVRKVDPSSAPGGLAAIAREAGLQPGNLASGGSIVIDLAGRRRVVDLLEIATIEQTTDGAPSVERLAIEQAIGGALAGLATYRPIAVCASTGHGELPLSSAAQNTADWTAVADRLRAEGMTVTDVNLEHGVPRHCAVLIVAGPTSPFTAEDALAVQTFLRAGGGLLVAAPNRAVGGKLGSTGLEGVLAAEGLGLPAAVAIDPQLAVRELPNSILVVDGYPTHPINAGFAGARPTLWYQPRAVLVTGAARPLITASNASWGERDLVHAPPRQDHDDIAGPVVLAALSGDRVIAIGSADSLTTAMLAGGASAGDFWVARAVRFLSGNPEPKPQIAARAPEQIRLVMNSGQRRAVIVLCVGGIPLAWVLIGGGVVWWRRRRFS